MSKHKVVDILSKEECLDYVNVIDSLSNLWSKRTIADTHHYTLGTATYLDIEPYGEITQERINLIKKSNEMLKENFSTLYDKVLKYVEQEYGPAELVVDGPIPGIFIYGEPKPNKMVQELIEPARGRVSLHTDGQERCLEYIWSTYNDVQKETLAFTLALEMPQNGAAFLLWDQPDLGFYSKKESASLYKTYDYTENPYNIKVFDENIINKIPEVIEHIPGKMLIQSGEQWHATGFSTKPYNTDRRITLQGFGVKCDGVWRLFF
jgi:hypothetical protein